MSFQAAKQIAPIIATTALLNKGERGKILIIIEEKENEKDFIIFISFGGGVKWRG